MSKNTSNQASSTNSNQKQDKSFSIWNLFNSKTKNCETKNCEDENCEFRVTTSSNGTSLSNHQLACCASNMESIKISNALIENLSETNSVHKRINFIKEFNEIIAKHHVCHSNFRLIIFKTLDAFGFKSSNEYLGDLLVDERKQTVSSDDLHQLRLNVLRMYTKLIQQQFHQTDQIEDEVRKILFDILIKSIRFDEPINQQMRNELNEHGLELLEALTNNGKKICCFRFEIDIFMLNWFDHLNSPRQDLICKYFNLLITLVRYHASAFMKTNSKFIEKINRFFMDNYENGHSREETLLCLELFDIIFRYSWLPPEVLKPFLITLCIAINYDNLRELAWKILRNLMNKDLAYIVINNLIEFLSEDQFNDDQVLITCGSLYFLSNSLWNEETKFDQIKHQPSSLLPTLSRLLSKENLVISTQIAISIKQLLETQLNKLEISSNGLSINSTSNNSTALNSNAMNSNVISKRKELIVNLNEDDSLLFVYWDHVWSILQQLTEFCSKYISLRDANQRSGLNTNKSDHNRLIEELDIIVTIIEKLFLNSKQFNCDEKTFNFICVYTGLQMRTLGFENEYPPFLIKRINILIDNYEQIIDSNCENWLQSLNKMMEQCFKNNLDTNLRIKTLKCLKNRLRMNTEKDEELIIDKIVLPYLKDVDQEIDFKVRDQTLRFLISFLKESSNDLLFFKVLEIISRVLKKTLNRSRNNSDTSNDASCLEEDPNVLIVRGLMEIFEERIYAKNFQPSLEVFKLLSIYVCSHHCEGGNNFEKISINMRLKILFFMIKIKPNYEGYIGFQKDDKQPIKYSKYLKCRKANQMPKSPSINSTSNQMLSSFSLSSSPSSTTNQFSYDDMFNYVNLCLSKERDWNILSIVLENLPTILSNPHIIYSTTNYEQIIRIICDNCLTLVKEFSNLNQTNNYINMPKNVKSADQQIYVFSVLTALIPYRDLIKPEIQTSIVSEIRKGLCSKESMQQCIMFLTIFTIEFQDAISKELTRILTTLSKTTASSQLAIPKLEFLSTLNLWPDLYSSFTNTEFLSIFAIILPYTNPMKFDDYCVAFAYRVSTMWYLSSRYQFRKTITDYIIKQLPENIKYGHKQSKDAAFTEEYRKRSSSLTTENDLNKKPTVVDPAANNNSGRLSGFTNNTLVNTIINSSNGNLHNSPAIPSPGLGNQNSSIFNFNIEKSNSIAVPNSPNPKQLASTTSVNLQQLNNTINHPTVQQQQSQELLHTEYVESFVDLMSRNVVCSCSTLPNQDPISKFLLENGLSETWVYGNKLITITTSSCNSKAVKGGDLCENCFNKLNAFEGKPSTNLNRGVTTINSGNSVIMNKNLNNDDDVFNEPTIQQTGVNAISNKNNKLQAATDLHSKFNMNDKDFLSSRRRHQSAFVPTASNSINRKLTSRDDLHMDNNTHMYNSCRSWASGWAEILIRTPTGNTSWIVKLQNSLFSNFQSNEINDLLLNHLITVSDHKSQTNEQQNAMCSSTNNQSSVSLNQQLSQISEQPYLTASTTNLSHQSALRGRSNTISTSSEMSLKRNELRLTNSLLRTNDNDLKFKNKMQPSFVFLQFFHQGTFGNPSSREAPILLPKVSPFENTLRIFDLITPSETYKVGIIYVDKNQSKDRQEILGNEYGSERYMNFIKRVGTLVRLDEIDSQKVFIGGLSQDGTDGDFACIHHENLTQVVFHVATFMPKKDNDPKSNDKMRHIGNNHVCIVYNDSQEEFDFSVIKGQWLKVCIIVTPFAHEQNFIHVQAIPELENLIMYKRQYPVTISDSNMPHFVRQLSISTSLMSLVYQCKGQNFSTPPFLSNWVNRIRKIKDIKVKVKKYSEMTDSIKHKPITSTSTNFGNNSNEDVCSAISDLDSIMNNFTNYI